MNLIEERDVFFVRQRELLVEARQRFALQLTCGVDLSKLDTLDADACRMLETRLVRRIERERQRGLSRHWSYDLNRHVALKQALDLVRLQIVRAGTVVQRKGIVVRSREEIARRRQQLRAAAFKRRTARTRPTRCSKHPQ